MKWMIAVAVLFTVWLACQLPPIVIGLIIVGLAAGWLVAKLLESLS